MGIALTSPKLQFFDSNGGLLSGGRLLTKVVGGGADKITYSDALLSTPNANPIILNARGECSVFAANGELFWLRLTDASDVTIWTLDNVQIGSVPTAEQLGLALFPRTAAEISASVTPVNYAYPAGDLRRYGTNTTPGTTDMTLAIAAWCSVGGAHPLTAPPVVHYVAGTGTIVSGTDMQVHGTTFVQHTNGVNLFKGSGVSNVTIRGGIYQGVGASTVFTDADSGLIYFTNVGATRCSNIRIFDTDVKEAYSGIVGIKVDGFWVQRNEVSDFFLYGILGSQSRDFHFDDNNVHDCARTSRTGSAPYVAYGIMATGDQAGGFTQEYCSVTDNHIKNVRLWDGIMSHDCRKLVVSGNTIDDVRMGIDIGHLVATNVMEELIITGNSVTLTTNDAHATVAAPHLGIGVIGYDAANRVKRVVVANNTIHNYSNIAGMVIGGNVGPIQVSQCDSYAIAGNVVTGTGTALTSPGISLIGTVNTGSITGNSLEGTMPNGGIRLALVTGDMLAIAGNSIKQANIADFAIYVSDSTVPQLAIVGNATNATTMFSQATSTLGLSTAIPSVASAAAVTLPHGSNVFLITGTTNITSVVATGHIGQEVTLIFSGALTFTDGSNLKLAGNLVTTADDTIRLVCDGASWFELSRSVN